ncbi:hypothetical protein WJ41_13815 [Burkholderia ubonensis]|uniref:3-oxoacyl-[acyl-carrier-protein] synthase III C-terminal domain-containing protein n=1 Tax=Burkholderia ubonensis TaxID=101571 RepID=UPI00075D772C|nr:3-oxoacyl-[acyl-carrier-protein] synthase III C-terminal domain-containing protein [Burkholderia ubonensis]KVH72204.1 hypothetical protein WJ41_13815 [Burkholderia ubonensis]KVU04722.1 hypothetical protein WK61_02375 [Burkholderia ubonensis]
MHLQRFTTSLPEDRLTIRNDFEELGLTSFKAQVYERVFGLNEVPIAQPGALTGLLERCASTLLDNAQARRSLACVIHAHSAPILGHFGRSTVADALRRFGLGGIPYFSLTDYRCVSFLSALTVAQRILRDSRPGANALILTGELAGTRTMRVIENVAITGDAAGAVLVGLDGERDRMLDVQFSHNGRFAAGVWLGDALKQEYEQHYQDLMTGAIRSIAARQRIDLDRVRWILPHNVNVNSWYEAMNRLGLPHEKVWLAGVPKNGHCFCTDMLLNRQGLDAAGLLEPGDLYLMASAGVGGVFGTALFVH